MDHTDEPMQIVTSLAPVRAKKIFKKLDGKWVGGYVVVAHKILLSAQSQLGLGLGDWD